MEEKYICSRIVFLLYREKNVNIMFNSKVTTKITSNCFPFSYILCLADCAYGPWKGQLLLLIKKSNGLSYKDIT